MQNNQGMGGGMGGASMQDMQRLQQQLQAQAQFQNQGQNNAGMQGQQFGQFNSNMQQQQGGGMSNTALAMMQQQGQRQPNQQQNMAGNNMAGIQGGAGNMASMFGSFGNQQMMQGGSQGSTMDASNSSSARLMAMAGMNMNQNNAANRSGGMMGMDSSSTMQNMQAIMQQQAAAQRNQNNPAFNAQSQQGQNPQQMFNQGAAGSQNSNNNMMRGADGNSGNQMNPQMMIQQQLATLQQRMQGQQQNAAGGMQGQNSSQNLLQQRQQQLLQQMQQNQRAGGNVMQQGFNQQGQDPNSMMQRMMQQQQQGNNASMSNLSTASQQGSMNNFQQQQQNAVLGGTFARGPLTEQQLRLRQQSILRGSSDAQSMGADAQAVQQAANSDSMSMTGGMDGSGGAGQRGSMNAGNTNMGGGAGMNNNSLDTSTHSNTSNRNQAASSNRSVSSQNQQNPQQQLTQQQKSFLDGNFAGGWQSNADLPDRRKVIFSILEVIKQMRPNTNATSTKLPHMAKSLEEHLYRSAQTKEEYLDPKTLKQRLQTIAQGLDLHRPPRPGGPGNMGQQQGQDPSMMQNNVNNSNSSIGGNMGGSIDPWGGSQNGSQGPDGQMMSNNMGQNQQQNWNNNGSMGANDIGNPMQDDSMAAAQQRGSFMAQQAGFGQENGQLMSAGGDFNQMNGGVSATSGGNNVINPEYPNTPKYQDAEAAQKRKVILQQQQRLLLLRHASKCRAGPSCTTKFCSQMVTLWKHMKTCRDKNCKTSHCLSSRCVLNHYRICKSQGKTATCEVCGPVMAKIKNGREDDSGDPLAQSQSLQDPQQQMMQQNQQQQNDGNVSSIAARMMSNQRAQASAMQGQNNNMMDGSQRQMGDMSQMQGNNMQGMQMNQMQAMMGGMGGDQQNAAGMNADQMEQNQLQQLQQHQMKMQAQLESLKELQRQQQQLLEQQGRLQEQSQLISDMNSPQAQQLRQQQMLLDQLQKRCHQQQLRLQQEIQMQTETGMGQPQQNLSQLPGQGMDQQKPFAMPQVGQMGDMSNSSGNNPGMDESSSSKRSAKKRGSVTSQRRGSGQARRGSKTLGKAAPGSDGVGSQPYNLDAFAKKRALVQSNDEKKKKAKTEMQPLAGETTSVIPFMEKDMIISHLDSLNKKIRLSSRTVTLKCMPVIQALIDDQFGWVFHDAVDPVALGLPDYFEVVKNPMHLALVKKKLENAVYPDIELFARDVKLVFENAILYNGDTSEVGELAQTMLNKFAQLYQELIQGVESSQQSLESRGEACSLCGNQSRRFEATVMYCRGKCGMQKIKRGELYYTDRTKKNHFSQSCYESMAQDEVIVLDDGSEITKADLSPVTHDSLPEEPWVTCVECTSRVYKVCALFTGGEDEKYTCPNCVLKRGDTVGFPVSKQKPIMGASDIDKCALSDSIEDGIQRALEKAYKDKAEERKVTVDDVDKANGLCVRVLSSVEKKVQVGEEMRKWYGGEECPEEYTFVSKCIGLFQKIHGVDTLLFAMYVQEYDHNNSAPNRRRVYISYVDSVQYFEPKCYRTTVYHAMINEYLRFVKARGFHTAHIWSCPPTPGDEYIFFVHPEHQAIPRDRTLHAWFGKALEKAKSEGIVVGTSNLYDDYFNKDTIPLDFKHSENALCLPYFEGDYIPGEIESFIKDFNSSGREKATGSPDSVMEHIQSNIEKMKDNFIVVHLRNRRFASAVEKGDDVSNWIEDSDDDLVRSKRAKMNGPESRPSLSPFDGPGNVGAKPELPAGGASSNIEGSNKRGLDEMNRSTTVKDTSDPDSSVDGDLFETRQHFMNYCQSNHCQFDELRRAKHSTLQILARFHKSNDKTENPDKSTSDEKAHNARERSERVKKQQQLMDERRRQTQNDFYQTGSEAV